MCEIEQIERKVISHLITTLKENGWSLLYVNVGNNRIKLKTEEEAFAEIFSVSESIVGFQRTDGVIHRVWLVTGNDGYDVISDHTSNFYDNFGKIMNEQVSWFAEELAMES